MTASDQKSTLTSAATVQTLPIATQTKPATITTTTRTTTTAGIPHQVPQTTTSPPPPPPASTPSSSSLSSFSPIITTTQPTLSKVKCSQSTPLPDVHHMVSKLPGKTLRPGPSALRQLFPIAVCLITFATVFSILIVYMDTTEIRHQQFRLNMSKDYDLVGVEQDDPTLITFIREIHMKKYPMTFMKNAPPEHLNFTERHEMAPEMAHIIATLVGMKENGLFVQSMTAATGSLMMAPWLSETLRWGGIIVESEPRKYFSLRKENAHRSNVQIIHACLSPSGYPKEVTLHHEDDNDVRINSLMDEEAAWFNSRVKCFPLYTLMLAVNHTNIELLSLGCQGQELQILETVPFSKVKIQIISIHLDDYFRHELDGSFYFQKVHSFLQNKSYKLVKTLGHNYIYQMNSKDLPIK